MTFDRIQELINLLPDNSYYFRDVLNYTPQVTAINKFLCAYKDLSFGYHCIKAFVKDNIRLPAAIVEKPLYDAYMFERYGVQNKDVIFAISLTHPSNRSLEESVKAFLLTATFYDEGYSNASLEEISKLTGLSMSMLDTYEKLFFNIRDRKQEALFIANVVYPDSRFVELNDNYLRNESSGRLLIRAAYNNGLDDVAYFSGLKADSIMSSGASAITMATKLESLIMTNGYFLARNFVNSKSSGIAQARNILIAAKQGGQDSSTIDNEGIGSLGSMAMQALRDIKHDEIETKSAAIAKLTVDNTKKLDEAKQLEESIKEEPKK